MSRGAPADAVTTEQEVFRFGSTTSGVLRRRRNSTSLSTDVLFVTPHGDVVDLHQTTLFSPRTGGWTHVTYRENGTTISCVNARGDPTVPDAVAVGGAIPSYAVHPLLLRFLASDEDDVRFRQFDESLTPTVVEARFVREQECAVEIDGTAWKARRTVLLVEGAPTNSFLAVGTRVLRSDWNGAESYPIAEPEAVLAQLDTRIRQRAAALLSAP